MATIKTYRDYSELAQASYSDLAVGIPNIQKLKEDYKAEFSQAQATNFANRYKVLATSAQYGIGSINGFDAVLFQDVQTGNKVMAIRGTDGIIDGIVDVVELSGFGTVISQTKSMENFYNALVANNTLGSQEQITLTGHSLGGFIAETFTAQHSDIIDHTYTYNAPGIGGVKGELLELLGVLPNTIDTSKVTNIAASDFLTIIAKFGVMIGDTVEIPGTSHSIKDMTNTLNDLVSRGLISIPTNDNWWIDLFSDNHTTTPANPADGHPFAPERFDPPRRKDPLVLDMNKDGLISTVSLADSTAFFDLTGDGIKERVGWVSASEGIVAFDKNGNGKIDGISEVFGTATTSGFAELRALADSNYDGVIDRRDELYNQLKVWQDANQDGISQANELKTLSQAGVNNIELDVFATNINLNGNLLTEAGRYGDSTGTRSLAADVELTFDARITTVDTSLIPDYTVHPESLTLPKLRGYGTVYNSEIAYNVNDNLRNLAIVMSQDITAVAKNFDAFIAEWSGLNTLLKTAQSNYNLSTAPILWEMDKKVWIYEHFMGDSRFSSGIESRINTTASAMKTGGSANVAAGSYTNANVNRAYSNVKDRYQAVFALQALYPQITNSTLTYDLSTDEFVLSDPSAFIANASTYMNSITQTLEQKLFLADVMNTLETTFLHFTAADVISGITDPLMKELVSGIYAGAYKANVYGNGMYTSGNILAVGSEGNDTITINGSSGSTILAGKGNDVIHGSTGNDVYLYRTGDGADTIIDGGGSDTLRLTDMLQSDIVLRSEGKNLILARAVDGKAFEELSDKVTLINWADSANRIDAIRFSDGSSLNFTQVLRDYFITHGDDRLDLTAGNDTIDSLAGNDVLHGLGGNDSINGGMGNDVLYGDAGDDALSGDAGADTLEGGAGNDTYLYNLGDGKDMITDGAGLDTLKFGTGIDVSMLAVQYFANGDMVIGLKEEGKSFENLSDTITIKGWNSVSNRLENILLSDGTSINLDALQIGTQGDDLFSFGDNGVTIDLLGGNDTVTSGNGNDIINGGAGNDTISSNTGNDTLSGNEGDDLLISGEGNDILSGGSGVDALQGGMGDDLYLYNRGDGKDTIIDEYRYGYNGISQHNAGNDTLRFGLGIGQGDLIAVVKSGSDDLILALREEGKTFDQLTDVITLKNWVSTTNRIETIMLNDGTIVDLAAIQLASEGNDNLIFGDNAVNIDALGGDDVVITGIAADTVHGGAGNDTLRSGDGNDDALYGDAGNDTLIAGSGNDTLSGGEGSDTLYGDNGNDTLAGNTEADTLFGGLGDDLYLFNLGDGRDTIIDEYGYGSGGNDTIRFGEGITKANLVARAVSGSNDLQIGLKEGTKAFDAFSDVVTLKNWFDANKCIENITLFDGTTVSLSEIQAGTDGDDYLVFGDSDTIIDAMGGNDTVISANGNDTLKGGTGNDTLISNNGNDRLEGGNGNDVLMGGLGDDTYLFNLGDGHDTIIDEHNYDSAGNDSLKFGEGITKADLVARAVSGSNDLQIGISETGKTFDQLSDIVTLKNWFDANKRVENFLLSDGTVITLSDIERATAGDDYLVFGDEGVTVDALAGNDTILSGKGNDTLSGGKGADTLKGGTGNDTYLFNRGDGADNVFDEQGADTLKFGTGITKDDLIFKQQENNLIVALAEVNKTFDQLSDLITITDWFKTDSNIELLKFADGSFMSQSDIASLFVPNNIQGALYSKTGAQMFGGSGNNTYVYNRGDFTVVIDDQYQQGQIDVNAGTDTLRFSGGINKNDVTIGTVGNDLILKIAPKVEMYEQLRDYVVIKNWADLNKGVEKVVFSNGETLTIDKTVVYPATTFNYGWVSSQYKIYGDDANTIVGSTLDETFETNGGKDTINAGGGNDRIYAGAGDDIIEGGAGNDVITMGTGDDSATDSAGDDVYLYNRGDGKDTVYDLSGNNTIKLGVGITKGDVTFKKSGYDLILALKEGETGFDSLADKVNIKNWYNANYQIQKILFDDGSYANMDEFLVADTHDYAMKFDGVDDALTVPNSVGLNVTTALSLTARFSYQVGGGMVVSKHFTNYNRSYDLSITADGRISFDAIEVNDSTHIVLSNSILNVGKMYDVAATYDKTTGISKIYINGILDNELNVGSFNIMQTSLPVVVGAYWGTGSSLRAHLNGTVSDVQIYDRALTSSEVITIASNQTSASGILAHYDFAGQHPLEDSSGNGHTAVVSGNPVVIRTEPSNLHSLHFNGGLDQLSTTQIVTSAEIGQQVSVSFEMTWDGTDSVMPVGFYAYDLWLSNGKFGFNTAKSNIFGIANNSFLAGTTHQITAIFTQGNILANKLYIDGIEQNLSQLLGSPDNSYADITKELNISGWDIDGGYGFKGTIDNVQLHNRALSASEIGLIAQKNVIDEGLVANYDFEGESPYADKSGNGHTAIVRGNPTIRETGYVTYSPPIILDLNYNGLTSTSLTDSHTYFDYAADGLKEHTAWIEKGDALLVHDINNDGIINDGSELFGDKTKLSDSTLAKDGYAVLAQYDTNSDGVVDKNDTNFSSLKIWKDANVNGKTDSGELIDLSVAGITSLSLNRTNGSVYTQTTENGNIITNETNYSTLTTTGTMRDVWFKIDANDTITDNDTIYGTTDSETLSGGVGNDTYVIAYGDGADIIDDNGNGADTIKFLSGITADRLIVQWVRGTDDLRIGIRENAEDDTAITELSNTITIKNWFNETGSIEKLIFADATTLNRQGIYDLLLNIEGDLTLRVLDKDGSVTGKSGNDVLYGVTGNELLVGKEGDDYLRGNGGDDYLNAGAGDDTLEGGVGADTLEGGIGDDYYLFDKGDGKDLIIDAGGKDTLYFGAGIKSRNVIINEVGEDLVLTFGYDASKGIDEIDQITIKNWNVADFKIESLSFSDGKSYTVAALIEKNTNHAPEMFFEEGERSLGKERSAKGILLADDIDGDTLTYRVVDAPIMGTISINKYGIWSYTGTSREAGTDTITVAISDGRGGEVTTTLSFAMEALNQAPDAPLESNNVLQDIRILSGEVGATDVDADTLTYSVITAAEHGILTIDETGTWSYAATEGYIGTDTAIITVDDSNGGTATQTLTFDLKVSAPTVANANASLLEDTNISGALSVINPIGGALTYEVVSGLSLGALLIDGSGAWSYTPLADANGDEAITIKVTNSYGLSTITTLNLSIEAVNDAPIVTAPIILNAVDEDSGSITITKVQLLANTSDIDGDTLDVTGLTTSAGTLVDNLNGTWTLSLAADYNGTIMLDYNVTDGTANVAAKATQTVLSVNDAPIIVTAPAPAILYAGATVQGVIEASDVDGDILNYSVASAPAHGALSIDDKGKWSYKAECYYAGESDAIITVADGYGGAVSTSLHFTNLMTDDWQYTYSGQELAINDSSGMDTLLMDNISMANLTFLQEGNNLRIDVKDKADVILTDYFTSLPKGVESIQAKEGPINLIKQKLGVTSQFFTSIWGSSQADLISGSSSSETIYAGDGNDIIFGGLGNDTLNGENGNDLLIGGDGSDTLNGGDNDDILYGDAGNDTLNGGTGDDKLFGGLGDDTLNGGDGNDLLSGGEGTNILRAGDGDDVYLFTKGANTTTVEDKASSGFFFFGSWCSNDAGNDTVRFGEGITKNDISFLMNGHDLALQYGTGELMTVKNQDNANTRIEKFELGDGSYMTNTDMDKIIQQLNAYKTDHGISITNNDQLRQNQAMMNIIASGWHQ